MLSVPKRVVRLSIALLSLSLIYYFAYSTFSSENSILTESDPKLDPELKPQPASKLESLDLAKIKSLLKFKHTSENSRDLIVDKNFLQLESVLNEKISEPKVTNLVRPPKIQSEYQRANATLMILARNSDIRSILHTMQQIENKFNKKFHYPYVLLNDKDFNELFKKKILNVASGEVYFEKIESEIWNQPESIDKSKQNSGMNKLHNEGIQYAKKVSYHNMCRFYSVNFYNHPRMQQFKYYWRFEPSTDYFCDLDYDVFKFMQDNDKTYGFVISLYDAEQTVESLWTTTIEFIEKHPEYVNPNGAFEWLTENLQNPQKTKGAKGYSTCHFWSNFEIADMDFYRSRAYSSWANYLESKGGFYYERWGDAPVHSIGVGLFEDKHKVHWFRDIGYKHHPYTNCPNSDKCSGCDAGVFTFPHLRDQNCITNWWNYEMDKEERSIY